MAGKVVLYNDGNCERNMYTGTGQTITLKAMEQGRPIDALGVGGALKVWYPGDGPAGNPYIRETAEWTYEPQGKFWYDVSWITGGASGLRMGRQGDFPYGATVKGNSDMVGAIYKEWNKEGGLNGPTAGAHTFFMPDPAISGNQPFVAFTTPSNNTDFETLFRNVVNGGNDGYVAAGDYTTPEGVVVKGDPSDNKQSGDPLTPQDTLEIHFGPGCPDFTGVQTVSNKEASAKQKRGARQQRRQRRQQGRELPVDPPVAAPSTHSYAPAPASIDQGHYLAGGVGSYAVAGMLVLLLLLIGSLIRDNFRLRRVAKRSQPLPDIKIGLTEA